MKTRILNGKSTFFLLFFSLCMVSFGWSQGHETFDNLELSGSSYQSGSFTGEDGINWNYTNARGDREINGKAITLQNNDTAQLISETISGGIGTLQFSYMQVFTNNVSLGLYVNGDLKETVTTSAEQNTIKNSGPIVINIEGDVVIEFKRTGGGAQVAIDDIIWSAYGSSNPPLITNVTQTPAANLVTSSDTVSVSADVTSAEGISLVELHWGLSSGSLSNIVSMSLDGENTYVGSIPAQLDGTTVYYKVYAEDVNDDSTTSVEYNYTVSDPEPFTIPYTNNFRTQAKYDEAEAVGFSFTGVFVETGAGGYLRLANGKIISPAIDFSEFDAIETTFSATSYGSGSGRELTVSISVDGGATYIDLVIYQITSSGNTYVTYTQNIDLTSYNSTDGRIKYEMTAGTGGIRFRDLEIKELVSEDYEFDGADWTPNAPWDSENPSTFLDDIYIYDGIVNFAADVVANDVLVGDAVLTIEGSLDVYGELEIDAGAKVEVAKTGVLNINEDLGINENVTLEVAGLLNVQGDLLVLGDLVFLSGDDYDGELGVMGGEIAGDVTVHRYMMDKRSFRVVASSVTTNNSIHDNWQEGAESRIDNPFPGYGTHITGTTGPDQTDGFDMTTTGTPSMYEVDYNSMSFRPIANTDVNTLTVGTPYLLFVRGDRSIDLTDNDDVSSTVLRATGELHQGDFVITGNNHDAGDVLFITNPYQCAIDLKDILENSSSNVNSNYFYLYDPAAAEFGAYITYNVYNQTTLDSNTDVNQYLQPGQAVQVLAMAPNPTVTINEGHKAPGHHTTTQRPVLTDKIVVQLYTTENYTNQGPVHDSFGIYFDSDYSNEINMYDAVKPMNFYENLGIDHDGAYYSIEQREMPQTGEVYQLYSAGYTHSDYTLKLMMEGLDEYLIYLDDHYTGNSTLFVEGEVAYAFEVNNDPLSSASDRFSIRVEESFLSVEDSLFAGVSMYPNPVYGDSFTIQVPNLSGEEAIVTISDLLGREIQTTLETLSGNELQVDLTQRLDNGIYLVSISVQGETKTFKLIKR